MITPKNLLVMNAKMKLLTAAVIGVSIILTASILGSAYTLKYRNQNRISATGLGEKEFVSDLIVWRGTIVEQNPTIQEGYARLAASKQKVQEFLRAKGIADSAVLFMSADVYRRTESQYSNGNYAGERFVGYALSQEFKVESSDVASVENVSREISSLLAQGVQIESRAPEYFYSKLSDLKQELIAQATADARQRIENMGRESGARLGKLAQGRLGVFQITEANSNEEWTAGGAYNASSKNKKASITVRLEYFTK